MVFSSFPIYLDHTNLHQGNGSGIENTPHLPPPPLPPPPAQSAGGVGCTGSIRPGSMVDRARMAKLPLPEAGLKCPRCESTNTKFCYFNNYSLSQPRHFCKTCRRYWTRGGALRNVPVGGGCRRNRRNKSSGSKSSADQRPGNSNSNNTSASPSSCSADIGSANLFSQSAASQLPLMASLQNLNPYGGGSSNIGSSFGGFQPHMVASNGGGLSEMGFQIGSSSLGGSDQQWRLPSLAGGFDAPANLFTFQSEGVDQASSSMLGVTTSELTSVKTEERRAMLNSGKQVLGDSAGNNQYWGGNTWPSGFSGLNSSSATNHLL